MDVRWWMRRFCAAVVGIALALNVISMPVAQAALISTQQEIEIGKDVGRQLEKEYGLVEDPELQARVDRIGKRMVAVCDRRDLPYSFKVLNSKDVNALAAPGGFIYVFKGLVDLMPSDDELAGVMGHELGHVVKRHTVRQMEKSLGMAILFGVVLGDRGIPLQGLAMDAIMAGYSRDDERQADQLGFIHSYKAGYNPYSMLIGLQKLSELDPNSHYDLFSDHPEGRARIALVQGYMEKAGVKPHATLTDNGKAAQIYEGDWKLPPLYGTHDGYKAIYRAEFAAGVLYRLSQLSDYNADKFIVDTDGTNCTIYYDDQSVLVVTPEDAAGNGLSVMDLTGEYVQKLKEWQIK